MSKLTQPEVQKDLLKQAYEFAKQSHDQSTQNAAFLVDEDGEIYIKEINRFPDGVEETVERWERPLKYKFVEHAERNAVYAAARKGISTDGLTMVCPWAPCSDCAGAIIQSGLSKLITHWEAYDQSPDRWKLDIDIAIGKLKESGVIMVYFKGRVGVYGMRHSGKIWNP